MWRHIFSSTSKTHYDETHLINVKPAANRVTCVSHCFEDWVTVQYAPIPFLINNWTSSAVAEEPHERHEAMLVTLKSCRPLHSYTKIPFELKGLQVAIGEWPWRLSELSVTIRLVMYLFPSVSAEITSLSCTVSETLTYLQCTVRDCNEVHLNYVKCIIVYTHITLALYRLD